MILCASAAVAADEEPSYKGRLLSEWLADVRAGYGFVTTAGAPDPSRNAIRAIGTNVIPTLLKWISYERSPSDKFPPAAYVPHWRWHALNPDELADTTPSAFYFLGAAARPAIPELTRLTRTSSDPNRADRCAASLANIGPEAIPSLLSLATNGPPWTRYYALEVLQGFAGGPEGVQTVPVVIECLGDTNTYNVDGAAQGLLLALPPAIRTPAIMNALQSASARARLNAIVCLLMWADEAPAMVPVPAVRVAMRDPDYQVRDMATNILRRTGGWELVDEQWVRRRGTNTLYGITPDFFTDAPGANEQR